VKMVNVLDDIQNEFREPRFRDTLRPEHHHSFHDDQRQLHQGIAAERFSDEHFQRLRAENNNQRIYCIMACGEMILGYGLGTAEASIMVRNKGYDPKDCLVIFDDGNSI